MKICLTDFGTIELFTNLPLWLKIIIIVFALFIFIFIIGMLPYDLL